MKKVLITGVLVVGCFIAGYSQNAEKVTRDASSMTITTFSSDKKVNPDKQMPADRSMISSGKTTTSVSTNDAVVPRNKKAEVSPRKIEGDTKTK